MDVSADEKFGVVIEALGGEAGVTISDGMFSATAVLKVNNKIFSMVTGGRLVVKLPRKRVDALVEAGEGERFSTGPGRVMKEWFSLDPGSSENWVGL